MHSGHQFEGVLFYESKNLLLEMAICNSKQNHMVNSVRFLQSVYDSGVHVCGGKLGP